MSILAELERRGVKATGISADSRQVSHGDIFVALRGQRVDGHDFIEAARRNGARGGRPKKSASA